MIMMMMMLMLMMRKRRRMRTSRRRRLSNYRGSRTCLEDTGVTAVLDEPGQVSLEKRHLSVHARDLSVEGQLVWAPDKLSLN